MKNIRSKSILLLIVSIFMLIISTIPHHHHEGAICFHSAVSHCDHDTEHICENSDSHHNHKDAAHSHDRCVADFELISSPQGNNEIGPAYYFVTMLWEKNIFENLFTNLNKQTTEYNSLYIETLHSTLLARAVPLRAPPASC